MIKFENINKLYYSRGDPVAALQDVSFEINQGEFISIVGKSGAGKTTLVKLLIGEEAPTSGRVFFEGKSVEGMRPKDLQHLRRKIVVILQDYKLLPSKTVCENV